MAKEVKTLTKKALAEDLADKQGLTKKAATEMVNYVFDEMAKKTVLRRLCKHVETDFESIEAKLAWDEGAGMDFSNGSAVQYDETVVDAFSNEEVQEIEVTEIVDDISDAPMPDMFK